VIRDDKILIDDENLNRYDEEEQKGGRRVTSTSRVGKSTSGTSLRKSSRSKSNLNLATEPVPVAPSTSLQASSIDRSSSASEQPIQSILKRRASTKTSTSKLKRAQVSLFFFCYALLQKFVCFNFIFIQKPQRTSRNRWKKRSQLL
jgi:hypothetical protein